MKPTLLVYLLLVAFLPTLRASEESDLLALLGSDAKPAAKAEACRQLRRVGTAAAIPALAAQLADERVSQAARHALEGLPFPEASAALREALPRVPGLLRAGLVDSLGWRRDAEAVPALVPLLADPDPALAGATASALGRIGTPAALTALQSARDQVAAAVRPAVLEGLLAGAERLAADGRIAEATALYRSLLNPVEEAHIQVAAYAGLLRTAGEQRLPLVKAALEGSDPAAQTAALAVAADLTDPRATATFTALVPSAPPAMQIALLNVLRRRGDPEALPVVLAATRQTEPAVRIAALGALGDVGDASVIPVLAEAASSNVAAEQNAARQALTALYRGDVTAALLKPLADSPPPVQRELFRALTARAERSAVPQLLQLARSETPGLRSGALQCLGNLADGRHLAALVQLLAETKEPAARDEVRGVFESLVERTPDPARLDVTPVLAGLSSDAGSATGPDLETRAALLQIGALFADGRFQSAFRSALKSDNPRLREAAGRALCVTRDPGLLPDLLDVARQTPQASLRSVALEGYVRLATEETVGLTSQQRIDALAGALALDLGAEDKRRVLSGISRVPHPRALELAELASADPAVKGPAQFAALQIAQGLGTSDPARAETALARLAKAAVDPAVQTNAQALLKQLNSGWVSNGPYRQEGKAGEELFDVVFPPEGPQRDTLIWQRAPGSTDLTRAGEVNLAALTGGDHCVVYAKTKVFVPQDARAAFALGSDDGIKLWVNGQLVHANNAVRGLTPGQDRASGRLQRGWNDLLVKITQHTAGCGFTLRITTTEGREIPDLRLDPRGEPSP